MYALGGHDLLDRGDGGDPGGRKGGVYDIAVVPGGREAEFVPSRDVVIIVFEGVQSLDVTGPLEVFTGAGPGAYRVTTASPGGTPVRTPASTWRWHWSRRTSAVRSRRRSPGTW
ncbi:hypothetical protein Acy02nite_50880 [Actinoplanes cyaneus]|uniref:Uncharacterized protein n=1 Tax=Actinoplanes cyaneus TaxID=52696 RepID=A0A919M601_9ACTN|nr:hypothetical protein Acy02nite_50880 [Actinoplanes cyaneus]